jgi:hypothetical protein
MREAKLYVTLLMMLTLPLLAAAPAQAQATRTWISGIGDDANPCSRTSPCRTFAGAITKTTARGEINCLDPGAFGAVTITKSITIACDLGTAGVLAAGSNGIIINGAATDVVVLRGLDINGHGSGLNGISIRAAGTVYIENLMIYDFTVSGISDARAGPAKLFIQNTIVRNNSGPGIVVAPAAGGTIVAVVTNVKSLGNAMGVQARAGSSVFLANNDILFNDTGVSGVTSSFGNNRIVANVAVGTTPTKIGQQ